MDSFTTTTNQLLDSIKHINLTSHQQQKIGIITAATAVTAYGFYKLLFKELDDGTPTVPYTDSWKGSSLEYRENPQAFVEKWTKALGPVYRVHLFGRIHTVVSGKYAREVFMSDDFDFLVGTSKKFDVFGMAGIFDGQAINESLRKTVVKHLNPQLKFFTPRVVDNLTLGLYEKLGDLEEPKQIPYIFPLVQRMVARGSATVFVGEKLAENLDVVSVIQNITTDIGKFHPRFHQTWLTGFPWLMGLYFKAIGKFSSEVKRQRRVMLDALVPEIDMRRAKIAAKDPNWKRPNDVLQELIENNGDGKDPYTPILDQLLILIFASVHTTSENGTIVLYRILQHPEIIHELLEEQQKVLKQAGLDPNGKSSDVFTFDVIKNMPKLDSLCRESLRLRNQFFELAHTNIRNRNIVLSNGTVIPPDGDVLINLWHNHHDGDDNDIAEFKPFRYVDSGYPATKVGDRFLVFGEGKHACPGRWFAVQEIKTIVSMLIRDYKIHATPGDVVFPIGGSGLPYGKVTIEKKQSHV